MENFKSSMSLGKKEIKNIKLSLMISIIILLTIFTVILIISFSLLNIGPALASPSFPELHNNGIELVKSGKYQQAIEYFDKALSINPNSIKTLSAKGLTLSSLGKNNEAINYYDKALNIDPNDDNVLSNKGVALGELGQYNEAIEYFDKALSINPNNNHAVNSKQAVISVMNKGGYLVKSHITAETIQIDTTQDNGNSINPITTSFDNDITATPTTNVGAVTNLGDDIKGSIDGDEDGIDGDEDGIDGDNSTSEIDRSTIPDTRTTIGDTTTPTTNVGAGTDIGTAGGTPPLPTNTNGLCKPDEVLTKPNPNADYYECKKNNTPPIANAGHDIYISNVDFFKSISLYGCLSTDQDNDELQYFWSPIEQNIKNIKAIIGNPNLCNSYLEFNGFPNEIEKEIKFSLQLVVNDGRVNSEPDYLDVTICQRYAIAIMTDKGGGCKPNAPPRAHTGQDQIAFPGDTVKLYGTGYDDDNDPLTYSWEQIGPKDKIFGFVHPRVSLSPVYPGGSIVKFQIDEFILKSITCDTTLTFKLIVNDGKENSEPDFVFVFIKGILKDDTNLDNLDPPDVIGAQCPPKDEENSDEENSEGREPYELGENDIDWRGQGKTFKEALDLAFQKTGIPKEQFKVTKWGVDKNGKSFPVEYIGPKNAKVNVDLGHKMDGPDSPHVGWQEPGKGKRGHILLDDVPYNRPTR